MGEPAPTLPVVKLAAILVLGVLVLRETAARLYSPVAEAERIVENESHE